MKFFISLFALMLMTAQGAWGQSNGISHGSAALVSGGVQRPCFTITNSGAVSGIIAYDPSGRYLAVAGDTAVQIHDTSSGNGLTADLIRTLRGHDAQILGVAFSETNRLVSIALDQSVRTWDIPTGKVLHTAKLEFGKHICFAIAPGLAADTSFGRARLWNFQSGKLLQSFEPGDSWASALAFTPDGKSLVIGTEKGVLRVMDVASWTVARVIDLDSPIKSLAASAEHMVVGYFDGTVAILNFGEQTSIPEIKKQSGVINALAFSPTGDRFASASADHSVKVWQTATLKLLCSLEGHGAAVLAVAFSPDGKRMASLDAAGVVNFWTAPR